MNLRDELKEKYYRKMPYKDIAELFHTSYGYVMSIATGQRNPQRGKGLEIKQALEYFVKNNSLEKN